MPPEADEARQDAGGAGPLAGCLVVSIEQAVAAPLCTARLAEMGARVIKVERPEGDFARGYDRAAAGVSAYFAWANQGKESCVLDLRAEADRALLMRLLGRADVFVQNLRPGSLAALGLDGRQLHALHPRLVTCDISGYGEAPGTAGLKAYDFLVQCESGIASINGTPAEPCRVGLPVCDIGAAMNAALGILGALHRRQATGRGSHLEVSLFDVAADLMAVPYLHEMYGPGAPARQGLRHPTIAPYGSYTTRDGRQLALSVQNDREWARLCAHLLPDLAEGEQTRWRTNLDRVRDREALEQRMEQAFLRLDAREATERLSAADLAFAQLRSVRQMAAHPALRTLPLPVGGQEIEMVANPVRSPWQAARLKAAPSLGEHTQAVRAEFGDTPQPPAK